MPIQLTTQPSLKDALTASDRALVGVWVVSGSPLIAEICAGAGFDWTFIDGEHSANGLESIQSQLQAIGGYGTVPVVRVPVNDSVLIKQYLDLGVQTLIVPMVDTVEDAQRAVSAAHYPPRGVRGVGSALARSSRWNRIPDYLTRASDTLTVLVQVESAEAVANAEQIVGVDGVDGVFIGPSDLAASMGLIGQQEHRDVKAAVAATIEAVHRAGKFVGVNAFGREAAHSYVRLGVDFVAVGADVALLARATEALAAEFIPEAAPIESPRDSY